MLKTYSKQFWLLSFSSYLFFTSFSMIIAELPAYLSSLGGEQYLGLIISLFTVTAAVSRPFSGKLTDRWGRIPVMVIGAVASGIAGLLYPMLATVWGFLLIRLIHGFSTGFKPTGTSAYVADIVPKEKRGEALGISSFFGTIGMSLGPWMGSTIFQNFGINTLFYCSTGFAIFSIVILAGMQETLKEREKFSFSLLKVNRSDIYEPTVIIPSVIMLLTAVTFGTVITLAADFSEFHGIENKGIFYTFFTGASMITRVLGGRLSDKYGRKSMLYFSTTFLFVSMLVIGNSTDAFTFFAGAILFGMGYGMNSPSLFAWTIDLSPEKFRGRGVSTIFIFMEVGIGLGALVSGTAYQGMDDRFPMIFGLAGSFSLIALFYLLIVTRKR